MEEATRNSEAKSEPTAVTTAKPQNEKPEVTTKPQVEATEATTAKPPVEATEATTAKPQVEIITEKATDSPSAPVLDNNVSEDSVDVDSEAEADN